MTWLFPYLVEYTESILRSNVRIKKTSISDCKMAERTNNDTKYKPQNPGCNMVTKTKWISIVSSVSVISQ